MNGQFQRAGSTFGGRSRAFTLIELLVVVAVIGVLTATILPALSKAKQRGLQTRCMSNLRQIGIALQLYVSDTDDSLPGPAYSGARASYDRKNSDGELVYLLADYLDSQNPKTIPVGKRVIAEVFVCPGYVHSAPDLSSMEGRKCYLLNDNVGGDVEADPDNRVRPFGYPEVENPPPLPPTPLIAPLKMSQLETYCSSASTFAVTDVDKANVPNPTVSWWKDLPYKPVHGQVRNELYFDWHVAAKQISF